MLAGRIGRCYAAVMAWPDIVPDCSDAAIADWMETRLRHALGKTGSVVAITVPGGSTPFPILGELATRDLAWDRVTIWPGDDRMVAEDHPASNVGRIKALMARTGAVIVPLTATAAPPHFALAWLGMGNDGHIASLFPNTDPRPDDALPVRRITPDPLPSEAPFDRLSLTIPALLRSDEIVFVIRGAEKRAVFDDAAAGRNDLPVARLLRGATQPVTCFA